MGDRIMGTREESVYHKFIIGTWYLVLGTLVLRMRSPASQTLFWQKKRYSTPMMARLASAVLQYSITSTAARKLLQQEERAPV